MKSVGAAQRLRIGNPTKDPHTTVSRATNAAARCHDDIAPDGPGCRSNSHLKFRFNVTASIRGGPG